MKAILSAGCFLLAISSIQFSWGQSTTGGRSGGSSASTGAGYTSPGKRPAASKPASMTIADEGASRDYMYVPPAKSSQTGSSGQKSRSASPDGSGSATGQSTGRSSRSATKMTPRQSSGKQ